MMCSFQTDKSWLKLIRHTGQKHLAFVVGVKEYCQYSPVKWLCSGHEYLSAPPSISKWTCHPGSRANLRPFSWLAFCPQTPNKHLSLAQRGAALIINDVYLDMLSGLASLFRSSHGVWPKRLTQRQHWQQHVTSQKKTERQHWQWERSRPPICSGFTCTWYPAWSSS